MQMGGNEKNSGKKWCIYGRKRQNLKLTILGKYIQGDMVKWPKKRVFGVFDPNNRIQQKIDPAYHVGNFLKQFLKKKCFREIGF